MSDIEIKLLSAMVGSPINISQVWDMGIRAEVFEVPINGVVFQWVVDYWLESQMQSAPTRVVMAREFPSIELDTQVEEIIPWMVSDIQQHYASREAQKILLDAARTVNEDPIGAMRSVWQQAYSASEAVAPRTTRSDMASNLDERLQWDQQNAVENAAVGVPYGLDELDQHSRGMLPGELTAVAAFTKVGKSFMLCKTLTAAHQAGYTPILFTLEMSIREMQQRIDALYSGVSYQQITEGSMMPESRERLSEARERIREQGPLLVERPARGERTVKHMISRARQAGANFVLIDQLSFMDAEASYGGDQAMRMKHGEIIFDLKDEISRESAGSLPCMLAVQLNRETMRGNNGGRGALENFANSSFIEQTVDTALGLWRNEDMREHNVMGLDIMGSRRSDKRSWLMTWRLGDRTDIRIREEMQE